MTRPIVYLACPYSHPDAAVRLARFEAVTRVAARLICAGRIVYSPITASHPIDLVPEAIRPPSSTEFWVAFDEAFMEHCAEMIVLRLDGWDRSSGVAREIAWFTERGRPVTYMDPPE